MRTVWKARTSGGGKQICAYYLAHYHGEYINTPFSYLLEQGNASETLQGERLS